MADHDKKPRKLSSRDDEEIHADALARKIASEPRTTKDTLKDIPVTPGNYRRFQGGRTSLPRGIMWGVVGLIVVFVGGFVISYYVVRGMVAREITMRVDTLQEGVTDLQNFNPQSAEQEFQDLNNAPGFGGLASALGFFFQSGSRALQSFTDLSRQLSALSEDSSNFEGAAFTLFSTGNGSDLIANLTSVKNDLAAIDADSNVLASAAPATSGLAAGYLPLKAQVEEAESFLNNFIPWFAAPAPHHLLIMLQNPSEERPGGGFLGSYADVTIASGSIMDISIHDITDVDTAFTPNIIPPVPLQLETTRFRPADANWFFDFPTSASETINMFETSNLYAASGTTFDGAIAVSPKVVSDLLAVTGPITLGQPAVTFTSSTFLVQTQKIVQAGQATGATYPKAILKELTQSIFDDIVASGTTDAQKSTLAGMTLNWIGEKDVMVFFKDPVFENFMSTYSADGGVYELPQNFNGDYFAVVNTDINADKSELYVAQNISFDAEIGSDGTVTNHVIITRTHNGNESPYWWYRTTNQDYLQVFVSPDSALQNEDGGIVRTVPAPINYAASGYATDPLIASIASSTIQLFTYPAVTTHEEDGKEVFTVWSRVRAGASTEISFDYTHHLFAPPAQGVQYQFVFDKQAGSVGNYQFEIDAPLGYVFAENGLATYNYASNDPPGRLIVTLTLQEL